MEKFKKELFRSFKQVKREKMDGLKCSACGQEEIEKQSSNSWNAFGSFLKCHACGHLDKVVGGKNG